MTERFGRRRALAAIGAGLAAGFAGCGYQPGAGELEWTTSAGSSGIPWRSGDRRWLTARDRLVAIQNRSGRTFDADASQWVDVRDAHVAVYDEAGDERSVRTDTQYDGEPAVAADGIYVPLQSGPVTALEWPDGRADDDEDAEMTRWTTYRTGDPLDLVAGDGLVVGTTGDELLAFDADSGDRLFALEFEVAPFDAPSAVVVAGGSIWVADGGDDPALYRLDDGGDERLTVTLPSEARWLEPAGDNVLVGLEDDGVVWHVDAGGDRRYSLEVDSAAIREPPVVTGDRLYVGSSVGLVAVAVASGEREWTLDSPFFGEIVADDEGIYGRRRGVGGAECGLVAVTAAGEERWASALPDDVGCSGDLFLLEDRLVVVDGGELYGFRRSPGRRYTLL